MRLRYDADVMRYKKSRQIKLVGVGLVLAVMGFGCRAPGQRFGTGIPSVDEPQNTAPERVVPRPEDYEERPQPTAPVVTDFPRDDTPSEEVLYLRQVFQSLGLANSYRAEMFIPSPAGKVLMEIFYNRDSGIYGKIHAPESQGGSVTEVYIDGDTILFRDETGAWSDITGTQEASDLVGAFSNAVAPTNSPSRTISTKAEISIDDSVEDCRLYNVKQYVGGGGYENFSVCTYADLPKRIELQTGTDIIKIEYYDIDGDVKVYKPSL